MIVRKTYSFEESQPPIAPLDAAKKSGAITIEPEKALEFLRAFHLRVGTSTLGWEQKLCEGK